MIPAAPCAEFVAVKTTDPHLVDLLLLGERIALGGTPVTQATRMQQYSLLRFWCSLGDPFCTEDDVRTLSAFLPRVTNECVEAAIRGLRNARSETSARSEWDRRFLAQFS